MQSYINGTSGRTYVNSASPNITSAGYTNNIRKPRPTGDDSRHATATAEIFSLPTGTLPFGRLEAQFSNTAPANGYNNSSDANQPGLDYLECGRSRTVTPFEVPMSDVTLESVASISPTISMNSLTSSDTFRPIAYDRASEVAVTVAGRLPA